MVRREIANFEMVVQFRLMPHKTLKKKVGSSVVERWFPKPNVVGSNPTHPEMALYGIPLSLILFFLAMVSMITNRQSILLWFFAIELLLLSRNLLFLSVSRSSDTLEGQVVSLFVLTVAAAESSIGLSLLVMYYRTRASVSLASFAYIKE